MPFLAVRISYAMLAVFHPQDTKWDFLSGSIGVFVAMNLIMEYAAMVAFISVGLMIPRIESKESKT